MKTRLHLFATAFLLALGLYACQEPAKTTEQPQSAFAKPGGGLTADPHYCHKCDSLGRDSTSCTGDRYVRDSCVPIWEAAWKAQLTANGKKMKNEKREFTKSKVTDFLNTCDDCGGVRIYFGSLVSNKNADTSLVLVMANVKQEGCDDVYDNGKVLSAWSHSDGTLTDGLQTTDWATEHVQNWASIYYGDDQTTYLPTTSYTMELGTFKKLVAQAENKIVCNMAIHPVDSACAHGYGWPVGAPQVSQTIDLVIRPDVKPDSGGKSYTYLDFARPCPRYCGIVSLAD